MAPVPNASIIFRYGDRKLRLDYRKLSFNAWGQLKSELQLTPRTLMTKLDDWDLDAVGAIIWLERKQRERKLTWREVYNELNSNDGDKEFELLDILADGKSVTGEPTEDNADENEEPDPTGSS